MFIAVHYVKINGVTYTPGEFIQDAIGTEDETRFMRLGAIRKAAEAPFSADEDEAEGDIGGADNDGAEGDDGAESDNEGDDETEDEADEEYEEAEPMEIDVADSITPAEEPAPQEEKKPTRKRRGGKE